MNANELNDAATRRIPAEYLPILNPEAIANTMRELDLSLTDILNKGNAREAAYQEKAAIMFRARELETEIELKEAEAMMQVQGEGRSAYVVIGDQKTVLSNEDARKAYCRSYSKELRSEKAGIDARIAQIDIQMFQASDAWQTALNMAQQVRTKGQLQARLLAYLVGDQEV